VFEGEAAELGQPGPAGMPARQPLCNRRNDLKPSIDQPKRLPDAPKREDFQDQEEFEEAKAYWQNSVGRIKGLVALSKASNLGQQTFDVGQGRNVAMNSEADTKDK
jgi:hypothetical protein